MRKIKETLRLFHDVGLSQRQTAQAIHVARSTVQECLARAARAGVTWPLPDDMNDETLERLLYDRDGNASGGTGVEPDWRAVSLEKRRKGVTLQLLWEEYRHGQTDAYSYSRFCELYAAWRKKLHPTMRLDHKAGERAFIDYAGLTAPYIDAETGEWRQAQIFVAVLGASNYMYVEAHASQELGNWLMGHVRAFEYWGGVPELLIVDNLKSGVNKAHRYDPELNPAYQDFAEHYGLAILPARARKPRDKAKVEVAVQIAERWILARLRHRLSRQPSGGRAQARKNRPTPAPV